MSGFTFGDRSIRNLIGVHKNLVDLAMRAIELSEVDFAVIEGLRSAERQEQLFIAGASQRRTGGKHEIGHAIDTCAWVSGMPCWDWHLYPQIARAFQEASQETGVQVVWGAVWDRQLASMTDDLAAEVERYKARRNGKAFIDAGHFELRFTSGMDQT